MKIIVTGGAGFIGSNFVIHMVNEVGADETGAACYDDSHGLFLFSFYFMSLPCSLSMYLPSRTSFK